ncbi:MAG TPA: NUDIX hydrolase [Gemmatimonadaceae bacterium]|nr:NUDIX hydrolase [Gemmatimonadaceae bacterium]
MPPFPTKDQTSAGGVAYRVRDGGAVEVALVSVPSRKAGAAGSRWQLPKGIVEPGEPPEAAALREVREEAGIDCALVAPVETIEYWYVATERGGGRVRYHKRVHFFLFRYQSGDVADHDHEVDEARWVDAAEAEGMLAFPNERKVVAKAREMIER